MAYSLGKKFEERVKGDWETSLPNNTLLRLPDQQSRYKGQSSNPCDYIGFAFGKAFMIECKETKESTFNWAKLRQYDDLLSYDDKIDTYPGVLIWFSSYDTIVWLNVIEIEQMKKDGKKSLNIKDVNGDNNYKIYLVPSTKLRTFLKVDFNFLKDVTKEIRY